MKKYWILLCLVLVIASSVAYSDVIKLKQGADEPGTTNTTWDAAPIYVNSDYWSDFWLDYQLGATSYTLNANTLSNGLYEVSLIGIKDLFTVLPATLGGQTLQINSATLRLNHWGPNGGEVLSVSRVTNDWMQGPAGSNEDVVTGLHKAAGQMWAGEYNGFGAGDFTTANQASFTITNPVYNGPDYCDVTGLLRDIYASGQNYGFMLQLVSPLGADPYFSTNRTTGIWNGYTARPMLSIDYTYTPEPATMSLLVLGGLGALLRRRK